ncbi:MAG: diaminopimelate decarboxylase [Planctomycetota bacterium]
MFCYSVARIEQNLARLHRALDSVHPRYRIFYAIKANRYAPLLTWMKSSGLCGLDVCSPAELLHALAVGFRPEEISYTATGMGRDEIALLARNPDVQVNCDGLNALRRLGQACPGRHIGIRINPSQGTGYGGDPKLRYSGRKTTKFGIYRDQFDEALRCAGQAGLVVSRIHLHIGCGYLNPQLEEWAAGLDACQWFIERVPDLTTVNLGGGLGVPHREEDEPLDLDRWASIVAGFVGGRDLEINIEPGDYVVKDAGILAVEVNAVERKQGTVFVTVNAGFNVAMEPVFYNLPCEPVACLSDPKSEESPEERVTIAGPINEALDVWAEDRRFPAVGEGDIIALLNAGGYAASMGSDHCLRGQATETILFP